MPDIEVEGLIHTAVVWDAETGSFAFDAQGRVTVTDAAREIPCRWVERQMQATDQNGDTITLDAQVQVIEEIKPGSVLWKGEISQLPAGATFEQAPGPVMLVKTASATDDIRGVETFRQLGCQRYRDTLPETV